MEILDRIQNELDRPENKSNNWVLDNTIMLHRGGSYLYGTNHKDSDIDVVGVCIPPKKYWVGMHDFEQWQIESDDLDVTIYSLKKWIRLAAAMNPNVIETLFIERHNSATLLYRSQWDKVVSSRNNFLNR